MFVFFFIIFKEEKKAFDRHTAKICQSLERYLNLKSKINDNTLQEVPTHSNHCQEKKNPPRIISSIFVEHVYFELFIILRLMQPLKWNLETSENVP